MAGRKDFKFQVKLGGNWRDFDPKEDQQMKRAYLLGHNEVNFITRGQKYLYSFKDRKQKNCATGKEHEIRAPHGMKRPKHPIVPPGPTIIIKVESGMQDKVIELDDPNNSGRRIKVHVPAHAKPGAKMAVPVPEKGEAPEAVVDKQRKGMSVGGKIGVGVGVTAGVGAGVLGGVLLGDHLAGGTMAADGATAVADFAGDAGTAIADFAGDAGDAIADGAEDVGEWLVDAGEDIGEWVMNVF